jgi:hypothetical protein
MEMKQIILDYLASPKDRKNATSEEMTRRPGEAFDALMTFRGPYPKHTHVVDVFPDFLAPLLTELLRTFPDLLIGRDLSKMSAGERWVLISAAIESDSPQFTKVVLAGLRDRSIEVRHLAVNAVIKCAFLRIPEARPQLQRLLDQKSMSYCRDEVQRALDSLDKVTKG